MPAQRSSVFSRAMPPWFTGSAIRRKAVPTNKEKLLQQLRELLADENPEPIDEARAARLRERLPAMSDRTFRDLLRASERALDPLVEGVRQESFENLERTLSALSQAYESGGDRRRIRELVIVAKDHARLAGLRADEARRSAKDEMVLWMLTWLENPPLFPAWVELRKKRTSV